VHDFVGHGAAPVQATPAVAGPVHPPHAGGLPQPKSGSVATTHTLNIAKPETIE